MNKIIFLSLFLLSSLSFQEYRDLTHLTECKGQKHYKLATGEEVVIDCVLENDMRWIVGWNPSNFVGLRDKSGIIASNNYKEKEEDGYIIDCKAYQDPKTKEYTMVCVFGEEDGDWGFRFFRIQKTTITPLGGISITQYSSEMEDYTVAPEDKIKLKMGTQGLRIDFEKNKYKIWDKSKKEWKLVETELHYVEKNGTIELIE